jgi:hypothetical protein
VLPLLMASENNFYRQDNIQKLALKLRISESDLLMWARDLQRIDAAKQSKKRQRYSDPPPTFLDNSDDSQQKPTQNGSGSAPMPPPPDNDPPSYAYDDEREYLPNIPDDRPPQRATSLPPKPPINGQAPKKQPVARSQQHLTGRSSSRATEAHCLRMLLRQPALLAQVNRKLRELAGNRALLSGGPLADLTLEDFTQSEYRAILDTLRDALAQDEVDPMEYLRQHLDEALSREIDELLLDEAEEIHRHVKNKLKGEFEDIWKRYNRQIRPGLNPEHELVTRALYVRRQRLERENRELRFLLEDARRSNDPQAEEKYYQQTVPVVQALWIIQRELKNGTGLL